MSVVGATDNLKDYPKFPAERTIRNTITFSTSSSTVAPGNTLFFANGTAAFLSNSYVANGTGGNAGVFGFNENGPYIINLIGGNPDQVVLSNNVTATILSGTPIIFEKPIVYMSNTSANSYANNTILITPTRLANTGANLEAANATVHVGWNLVTTGTGGRAGRIQVETLSVVANAVASNTTSGGPYFPGT